MPPTQQACNPSWAKGKLRGRRRQWWAVWVESRLLIPAGTGRFLVAILRTIQPSDLSALGLGQSLKPIIHNGQVMTLDHLAPFTFKCPCPDINRDLSIRAQFANHHCYTKAYDPVADDAKEIIATEGKDRHRVFCPARYELSHRLPKLIPELPNKRVHQTSQSRNYVYIVPLEIVGNPYEIYFMLRRAG
jgi:hypothetical protein